MKCTNKCIISLLLTAVLLLSGCAYNNLELPYKPDSNISSFRLVNFEKAKETTGSFASGLCVTDKDISVSDINLPSDLAGALFDINGCNTIYAHNIHEQFYPASLTKILTAIVALKNGSSDMILTASSSVKLSDPTAQVIGLKPGDTMTLDQALHILLIYSANDVAVLIAEGIGGSIENFTQMMNEQALLIGATNSNFTNPHGLSDENHYTTPYDMYLIMNEAIQFESFKEIINCPEYQTVYYDAAGNEKEVDIKSTNAYLTLSEDSPNGVTVIGGKTGTTNAAGHCLVLLSKDNKSNDYISIIMKSDSKDNMYKYMTTLLKQIGN